MKMHIYKGKKSNGDWVYLAIDPDELGEVDEENHTTTAEDYFVSGTEDIEKVGEVDIVGDDNFFDSGCQINT